MAILFVIIYTNEPVGKVLLTRKNGVSEGYMTHPRHEIVDSGACCEVILFYI